MYVMQWMVLLSKAVLSNTQYIYILWECIGLTSILVYAKANEIISIAVLLGKMYLVILVSGPTCLMRSFVKVMTDICWALNGVWP